MLVVRSILFNVLFYLNLLVQIVAALPTLAMPRWGILAVARFWARSNLRLLHAVCGVKVEFCGVTKIPPGPLLVSCKHQSLWETFALLLILSDPAYIMKRELMWIPFFGWYAWKAGMIPVDRSRGGQALADMNARARQELARNRQIIIFPEGGRFSGAEPMPFKSGLYHLAQKRPEVELIPVLMDNLNRILPKGEVLAVPLIASVTFGAPMKLLPDETKPAFLERARAEVMRLRTT